MHTSTKLNPHALARVVRAARKLSGKSQICMAQTLGISQVAYSRFESGKVLPTTTEWYALCEALEFNGYLAVDKGYIDHCKSGIAGGPYPESRFKMPLKYSQHAGTKIRTAKVLLNYLKSIYGSQKLDEYLKYVGVDPDLFIVMDEQINMRFSLEIFELLIQRAGVKAETIPCMVDSLNTEDIQGQLRSMYSNCTTKLDLFKTLFSNANQYEINSSYQIEEETDKYLIISEYLTPTVWKSGFNKEVLGIFLCQFKQAWFAKFSELQGQAPSKVEVLENAYLGAKRCLYKMAL